MTRACPGGNAAKLSREELIHILHVHARSCAREEDRHLQAQFELRIVGGDPEPIAWTQPGIWEDPIYVPKGSIILVSSVDHKNVHRAIIEGRMAFMTTFNVNSFTRKL